MQLTQDLKEFIDLLNSTSVRYLMFGCWAFNYYANPRATGDCDFFVEISPSNDAGLRKVLTAFGFGTALPPSEIPLLQPNKVLMLGRQPHRIDILTTISGVTFDEAWPRRVMATIDELPVPFIDRELLIRNKLATGRTKDLADAEALQLPRQRMTSSKR